MKKYNVELNLPFPPSVNSYYRSIPRGKHCQAIISQQGRVYKERVQSFVGSSNVTDKRLMVRIKIWMPDNRVRDLDNYLKALLDSLTGCVWYDDSQIDCIAIGREEVLKGGKVNIIISEI